MAIFTASDRGEAPLHQGFAIRADIVEAMVASLSANVTVEPGEVVIFSSDGLRMTKASSSAQLTTENVAGVVMWDQSTGKTTYSSGDIVLVLVQGIIVPHSVAAAVTGTRERPSAYVHEDDGTLIRGSTDTSYIKIPNTAWRGDVANGALGELEVWNPRALA